MEIPSDRNGVLLIILLDALLLLLMMEKPTIFFTDMEVGLDNHALRMISQTRIQKKPEVISQFCCVFLVLLQ